MLSEVLWIRLGAAILRGVGREKIDIRRWKIRDGQDTAQLFEASKIPRTGIVNFFQD